MISVTVASLGGIQSSIGFNPANRPVVTVHKMKRKIDFDISSMRAAAAEPEASSSSGANSSINPWTLRSYSSKYYEILQKRKQLPVYEFKDALEKAVKENQVVIVEGETGSGT